MAQDYLEVGYLEVGVERLAAKQQEILEHCLIEVKRTADLYSWLRRIGTVGASSSSATARRFCANLPCVPLLARFAIGESPEHTRSKLGRNDRPVLCVSASRVRSIKDELHVSASMLSMP